MAKQRLVTVLATGALLLTCGGVANAATLTLAWNPNSDGNTAGYVV
jgi:hypothetical protein